MDAVFNLGDRTHVSKMMLFKIRERPVSEWVDCCFGYRSVEAAQRLGERFS